MFCASLWVMQGICRMVVSVCLAVIVTADVVTKVGGLLGTHALGKETA